jgi:outer membrane protein, heavy metal efflux system
VRPVDRKLLYSPRRGTSIAIIALALGGCVSYHPAPLPDAAALAAPPAPDLERLKVEAAELRHPRLPPVKVDLSDGLSPGEAAVLAVLANPDLTAIRATHGEAAAQLVAAGLLPEPTLTVESDRPYGSNSTGTVDVVNLGLEVDVAAMIQRSARAAEAAATLDSVDLGIAWQEWQVAQSARLETLRIGWLARRIGVAEAELSSEESTLSALQSAMEQGDATLSDVGVQLAAVEGLRRSRGELRRAEVEARGELDRLLGLPATAALPVVLPPEGITGSDVLGADVLIRAAVDERLDLIALRRGYDAQEAVVRAAVLAQLPSLSVGVVHQRNESALKFLGGYVTLGLPIFGHPRAVITREEATRTRLGDELEARAAAVRADIRTLLATLDELAVQLQRAQTAVDRLEPVAKAERDAAVRGDVDRLSEQVVRTALSDARLELAALRQARDETLTGLETAVGCPLGSVAAPGPRRQP